MPSHEEHCAHSLKRYGVRGDDIHSWIDEPSQILGGSHRSERHDISSMETAIEMFGSKYGDNKVRQIFLDHLFLDSKEAKNNKATEKSEKAPENDLDSPGPYGLYPSSHDDVRRERVVGTVLLLFVLYIIAFIYNKETGGSIVLWWNQNWYLVVAVTSITISLFAYALIKSETFRSLLQLFYERIYKY